jgi:hypothetical protein
VKYALHVPQKKSNDTLKVDSFASGVAFVDISEMREVAIVFIYCFELFDCKIPIAMKYQACQ